MDDEVEMEARQYQIEIEEHAVKRNTIVYLPTGAGKTFIAIQVMKRFQKDLRVPFSAGGKRTFFLANTIALVNQHKKVVELLTQFTVKDFTSADKVDLWNRQQWYYYLENTQVLIMTSQILLDMLLHGYIELKQINLIIFDECHSAVDQHPMRQIMNKFNGLPLSDTPRVLGLTATLINKNIKPANVETEVRSLENTFRSTISTVDHFHVKAFCTNPHEIVTFYPETTIKHEKVFISIEASLKRIKVLCNILGNNSVDDSLPKENKSVVEICKPESINKKVRKFILSIERLMRVVGPYGCSILMSLFQIKLSRILLKCDMEIACLVKTFLSSVTTCKLELENYMEKHKGFEKIAEFCSPKLSCLLNILSEYNDDNNTGKLFNKHDKEICCLIFVKERLISILLYLFLKNAKMENPTKYGFLNPNYITGFNSNPYNDTREDLYEIKRNKVSIMEFKNKRLNCLVSTDILEEGFDLPQCNLVIRFDKPLTFRSYIQSKGRGRYSDASFVTMIPRSEQEKYKDAFKNFQTVDSILKEMIFKKDVPAEDESKSQTCSYKHKNATITLQSALSLLYRYCSTLPQDLYTQLQPRWFKDTENNTISLQLPINCPLKKKISSGPVKSQKKGRQLAALNALVELHKINELNDDLLPTNKVEQAFNENTIEFLFPHWKTVKTDKFEGKKKTYDIKFPRCLDYAHYAGTYYLQNIIIKPQGKPSSTDNEEIFKLMCSKIGFAIITHHKVDKLCPFTLFLSSGEFLVYVENLNIKVDLTEEQLDLIKKFHLTLFLNVLEIQQSFVAFDSSFKRNHLYIVPSYSPDKTNVLINWDLIYKHCSPENNEIPSIDERRNLRITNQDYLHSVVTPWYRCDNTKYVVTEVCESKSPQSEFPNSEFQSFIDYFASKYDLIIHGDPHQPLLKVKPIGGKLNSLLPRSISLNATEEMSKKKLNSLLDLNSDELSNFDDFYLIGEFCTKYSFPGVLWVKATLLPSIIHRWTMLLQAEELRQTIAEKVGIGQKYLPEGVQWPAVKVDIHSLKYFQKKVLPIKPPPSPPTNQSPPKMLENSSNLNYEIQKKNIDNAFPWPPESEPLNIYEHVTRVNLLDVECYDKFMTSPITSKAEKSSTSVKSPEKKISNAICAPPPKYLENITILNTKPSLYGPSPGLILEGLTNARSNDVFNLERYETLGDSFLKFAATLFLWQTFPKYNEGHLTLLKCKIISNKHLLVCGDLIDLPGRMKIKKFTGKFDWIVPCFFMPEFISHIFGEENIETNYQRIDIPREEMLSGQLSSDTINQITDLMTDTTIPGGNCEMKSCASYFGKVSIQQKEVADSVEAIIGIYLSDSGIESTFKLLRWLSILPIGDNISEFLNKEHKSNFTTGLVSRATVDYHLDYNTSDIEKLLGYTFKDPSLLLEALSHASNIKNNVTECYQRLEFIGDAILDFLITCHIYEQNKMLDPGDITDLRSALVNNVTFACLVVRLGLHNYILTSNIALDSAILKFVDYQQKKNNVVDDSVMFLLEESNCNIATYVDVPKVLGDIYESIAGAIYIDSGKDLNVVWKIFYRFMHKEIAKFSQKIPKQPVRLLYEQIYAAPKYLKSKVLENGKVMVPLIIKVQGKDKEPIYGIGDRKEDAKRSAAKIALKILNVTY